MRQRKLQIFISSTYEDLVEHRLAAFEAILAAGHIPAAMEQFTPGDETAWEKIQRWIDESDAFILILGGRYGSLEPASDKSYVQIEYEYALERRKPYFALVVNKQHHEERVKQHGLKVDERENPDQYKRFHTLVTAKLCAFWADKKDIQAAIFRKLPEWAQREDLAGWVRAEDAPSPALASELAKLSQENRELRGRVGEAGPSPDFDGLSFEDLVRVLKESRVSHEVSERLERWTFEGPKFSILHVGHLFERLQGAVAAGLWTDDTVLLSPLLAHGLVGITGNRRQDHAFIMQLEEVKLTETGRRFRNRLLASAPLERRLATLWASPTSTEGVPPGQ